ncbi:MAG: RagB/SusD family nutrient uptake outer membrane protein [Odoribacter sp.]
MKKMIRQLYVVGVVLLLGLTSCNDWLDVQSKVDIKEDEVFNTESGYWDALVGVYSKMTSNSLYGTALTMSTLDILACNYDIDYGYFDDGTYNLSRYNYKSTLTRPRIDAIWSGMYTVIANDNNLLRKLNDADRKMFEGDHYNWIKGEALALRAYLHFDLLRMFGKSFHMDPDAKAIPYVSEFGKDQTPLSTGNEVVELALKDLEEALVCLENDPVIDKNFKTDNIYLLYRQNRMNYYAVQALMARIYMYRGTEADREKALKIADSLIDDQTIFTMLASNQMGTNRIMSIEMFFCLYKDNISDVYKSNYLPSFNSYGELLRTGKLTVKKKVIDDMFETSLWGTKDGRLKYQFNLSAGYYFLTKYEQRDGDDQYSKYRIPMLRLSEMYYISAECTKDVNHAITRMKALWRRRGYGLPNLGINTLDDVKAFVAKEYRREFYGEGQLFYYYKRNNVSTIPNCKVNITDKLEEVYVLPVPEDELNYGK